MCVVGLGGNDNVCQSMCVETSGKCVEVGCLLPQGGFWDLNSGPYAWQQESLST